MSSLPAVVPQGQSADWEAVVVAAALAKTERCFPTSKRADSAEVKGPLILFGHDRFEEISAPPDIDHRRLPW